jgi:hemolysin activation/secretion protein
VRGYKESEVLGDDAVHGTVELIGPDLGRMLNVWDKLQLFPYVFYDAATLWIKDPLPGQDKKTRLQGTGLGIRGMATKYVEYEVVWGLALEDTDQVESGDSEVYFTVKGQF